MQQRYSDFIVQVTLKENLGSFGSRRGPVQEFRFCAQSRGEAVGLAARNVPSRGFPFDTQEVRVVNSLPVFKPSIAVPESDDDEPDYEQCAVMVDIGSQCRNEATATVREPWTPAGFKTRCCEPCAASFVDYGYTRAKDGE